MKVADEKVMGIQLNLERLVESREIHVGGEASRTHNEEIRKQSDNEKVLPFKPTESDFSFAAAQHSLPSLRNSLGQKEKKSSCNSEVYPTTNNDDLVIKHLSDDSLWKGLGPGSEKRKTLPPKKYFSSTKQLSPASYNETHKVLHQSLSLEERP
eukprot:TRINITY_DN5427_c0_g1_i3.p1 TRINITY_DN5427_c0_g1~~TRINITY_DN5427_c0_g1_i3.p1  ORF type:complete len:154 (-),score=18.30 TRINITY_DN5427_c0_g1_i3:119-580(-)